jgi:UDP-N-acetylglucosamine 2-epimerase (non-hydrolysing)
MISIVVGTRPEIIKMSPIIRECQKHNVSFSLLHTGQHYSYEMDRIFFEELELPIPDYNLDIGSRSSTEQTAAIMGGIEKVYQQDRPDIVLVQGDTNSVLAGGLVAAKMNIPIGHVEAGLRSFDRTMPEEVNRVVVDHLARYSFAPTLTSQKNLIQEGISGDSIRVTGNTIVDALYQNLHLAQARSSIIQSLDISSGEFFLVTLHRAENVDNPQRLMQILSGISLIQKKYSLPVIFPIHPRTKKMVESSGVQFGHLTIIPPVGYFDFLALLSHAKLVLTDSGGIQEEACILKIPCVTVRENTERPETLEVQSNVLAGSDPMRICNAVEQMLTSVRTWRNPFGNGAAGEQILKFCIKEISLFEKTKSKSNKSSFSNPYNFRQEVMQILALAKTCKNSSGGYSAGSQILKFPANEFLMNDKR